MVNVVNVSRGEQGIVKKHRRVISERRNEFKPKQRRKAARRASGRTFNAEYFKQRTMPQKDALLSRLIQIQRQSRRHSDRRAQHGQRGFFVDYRLLRTEQRSHKYKQLSFCPATRVSLFSLHRTIYAV